MFRDDRCTIKRPIAIEEEGETIGYDEEIVAVDLPCHLSVQSISAVNQTQSTASVLLDYVLYIDTKHKISIKPNDEIIVTVIATGFEDEEKVVEKQAQKLERPIEHSTNFNYSDDDDDSDDIIPSFLRKRGSF
jgi:hypothetical protein